MKIKLLVRDDNNILLIVPGEEFDNLEEADARREQLEKETGREYYWRLPDDVTIADLYE